MLAWMLAVSPCAAIDLEVVAGFPERDGGLKDSDGAWADDDALLRSTSPIAVEATVACGCRAAGAGGALQVVCGAVVVRIRRRTRIRRRP